MSVYIKGMEMPESCFACPLVREDVCGATEYTISRHHWRDRADTCPLVPVPEHGRLIDADALMAKFKEMGLGDHSLIERLFADGVYVVIDYAPTIIPAEDGE